MVAGSATMKANVESDTRRCHGGGDVYLCNALLVPLNLQLLSAILNNGVKFFNFVGRNTVNFSLLTRSLFFFLTQCCFAFF